MTQAEMLAEMLQQQGWSVFWDLTIPPGKTWRQVIDSELTQAHCVVVAWSKASIHSSWVLEEADEGKQRGILIPVLFEPVKPPLGFRSIQAVNLADWNGETHAAVFQGLVKAIARLIGKSDAAPKAFQATDPASITTQNGGVELVLIPGGRFMMGSPEGEGRYDERPAHEVEICPFYLGRYPVTNAEFARFLIANPKETQPDYWTDRSFNQARQPVVGVEWGQVQRFAQWAGGRLPSEAEWEYALRAGTTSRYFWGELDTDSEDYGWHYSNSPCLTFPVGQKRPNAFGLHDMVGNVWEWMQDNWHDNYCGAPSDGSAWEVDADGGGVLRSGSWLYSYPNVARSAYRYMSDPDDLHYLRIGFRLARTL